MSIEEVRASNSSLDDFFSEIEHDFSIYSNPKIDEFLNFSPDDYAPADNLNVLINGIQYYIKSMRENISKFYGATKDSANEYKDVEKNEYNKSKTDLPDGSSIDISNNSSSSNNDYDDYHNYSDYNDYSDNMLNYDKRHNRDSNIINEIVVDDIILEKLAPFGINKSNIGEVISSDEYDYVITINETDTNQNGLSKIYIKNGNVVGGVDLNNNYVSIDNEKLILDNNNSSTTDEIGIISGGVVAGNIVNKSDTSISLDKGDVNPNVNNNIDGNSLNTINNTNDESKNNLSDITNDNKNRSESTDNIFNSGNNVNSNDNNVNAEGDYLSNESNYVNNNIDSNDELFDSVFLDNIDVNYSDNSVKNTDLSENNQGTDFE